MGNLKVFSVVGGQLLTVAVGAALLFSCSQNATPGDVTVCLSGTCKNASNATAPVSSAAKPETTATPAPTATPVPPLDAKQVLLKLRENCHGCHGLGKDKSSFWQTPAEFEKKTEAELAVLRAELTDKGEKFDEADERFVSFESYISNDVNLDKILTQIALDQFSVEVFKTIENSLLGHSNTQPRAMRPRMDYPPESNEGESKNADKLHEKPVRKSFLAFVESLDSEVSKEEKALDSVKTMSFAEAKSWCVGCHSPGGSGSSIWASANGTEKDWKEFAAAIKSSVSAERMPPPQPSGKDREEWLGVLSFFQKRFPTIVADARGKYHGDKIELGVPLDLSFKCSTFKTGREFINELTYDALDRPPNLKELELVGKGSEPVTKKVRNQLVAKLSSDWKEEFLKAGMRKFAEKISSSDKIRNSLIIDDVALKNDIALELYQHLKAEADEPYKNILLSEHIYASKLTAPFYGEECIAATAELKAGEFVKCKMNSQRKGFFTTLGFLAGRSSSMFQENNNYGRVAAMNEVLRGEPLRPNTSGETGETINPLPTCLVSADNRVLLQGDSFAPRGTITVPASGNFCQGCHIRRNLAAGSIAFRPFGPIGEIITFAKVTDLADSTSTELSSHERTLRSLILDSFRSDLWGMLGENGNVSSFTIGKFAEFLNIGTARGQEKGCIVDGLSDKPKPVTAVADLVDYTLSDELVLPRGLARIIPRALSNKNSTNPEVITAVTDSWAQSKGNLTSAIQAYFATDTYACQLNAEDAE